MKKLKILFVLLFITSSLIAQSLGGDVYFKKDLWKRLTSTSIGLSDPTDNVSIGTATPDASDWNSQSRLLHIYKNSSDGALIKLESSSTKAVFSADNSQVQIGALTNHPLRIFAGVLERMTLSATGNVGIGKDAPTAYLHLKVGTATANTAPFKFTLTGAILNTTPEAGALEPDATGNLYFTNSSVIRNRLPTIADNLSVFASTTSSQLAGVISDEIGSGALVFATSPTLVTPTLGVAIATSINKVAITAPTTSATLTLAEGSSLITAGANSLTLTTTGVTNVTLPTSGTIARTSFVTAPSAITVTASPFVYQNTSGYPASVITSGGTVTEIAVSRDNVTYYVTGQIAGMFQVSPSDYIKVTYTAAPTMTLILR